MKYVYYNLKLCEKYNYFRIVIPECYFLNANDKVEKWDGVMNAYYFQ
jgi:hypothetical protein